MRVLVTGATGMIGKELCRVLAADGNELVILSRRPEASTVAHGSQSFRWNPDLELPPKEAWDGVDAVVHLAGEPVAGARWTEEQKRRIRDSRVKGTRNLIDGMKQLAVCPQILVSGSAVGFYGNRGQELLDERSSAGKGFLSEVCVEWEHEAERAQALGVSVSLIRTGVVLGMSGGALEKMLLPFKLGLGGRLGDGQQWFPWIHEDDIVGIVQHALFHPQVSGPVNGVAPGIVNNAEFTTAFAAGLNRPTFFPVPEFALRLLMGEMADVVLASQRVFPKVALNTGYKFKYTNLPSAIENILKHRH